MHVRTIRLSLAILALCAIGCGFQKPTLRFKSASLAGTDLEGTTLNVVYGFNNPNPLGLDLAEVSYALEVEGHSVISGKPPNGLSLPSKAETDLVFPARVRFLDLAPALEALLTKDVVHYKVSGSVGIQTPIGVLRYPFSYENTFGVPKIPAFAFQSPRVQSLSFTGARLVFPIQLTNQNSFPLPLGGFSAAIAIAGTQVGTSNASLPATLSGGATHVVELPLDVNFLQTGMAIANAIRGGNANVKLDGALRSGAASVPIRLEQNLPFR
jgi:LEA14-like dessication related protein